MLRSSPQGETKQHIEQQLEQEIRAAYREKLRLLDVLENLEKDQKKIKEEFA
jgi:hypothetical protein